MFRLFDRCSFPHTGLLENHNIWMEDIPSSIVTMSEEIFNFYF